MSGSKDMAKVNCNKSDTIEEKKKTRQDDGLKENGMQQILGNYTIKQTTTE